MQPRNPYLCITIVVQLGLVALAGAGGVVACALSGRETPTVAAAMAGLGSVVSGCVGALSSFLVNVPRGSAGYSDAPPKQLVDAQGNPMTRT